MDERTDVWTAQSGQKKTRFSFMPLAGHLQQKCPAEGGLEDYPDGCGLADYTRKRHICAYTHFIVEQEAG